MITIDEYVLLNTWSRQCPVLINRSNVANEPYEKLKERAQEFCRKYRAEYRGVRIVPPRSFGSWQHERMATFEIERSERTSRAIYEYGRTI